MLISDPLCEGSSASSTHKELWRAEKPFLTPRKERHALKMTLSSEGSNASSTNKESDRSQSSGERINSDTQNERELRRSEGSSMLINDPLGEGSNASSYRQRALESGGLLPQMRGNLDVLKGAACS